MTTLNGIKIKALEKIWGKTCADDTTSLRAGSSLLAHSLECAAVADVWLRESPRMRRIYASHAEKVEEIIRCLVLAAFLHDIGKTELGYQWQGRAVEIWRKIHGIPGSEIGKETWTDHSYTVGMSDNMLYAHEAVGLMNRRVPPKWRNILQQSLGHHDRRASEPRSTDIPGGIPRRTRQRLEGESTVAADAMIDIGNRLFLNKDASASTDAFSFEVFREFEYDADKDLVKGFFSLCDWISSESKFFPRSFPDGIDSVDGVDALWRRSIERAREALSKLGLIGGKTRRRGFGDLYPGKTPRGLQLLLPGPDTPMAGKLYCAEAGTGSGKTAFGALLGALAIARDEADSIIFAMPSRTTANYMFKELEDPVSKLYNGMYNLFLSHGKTEYFEPFKNILVGAEMNEDGEGFEWLASSRRKSLLGRVAVCTVDQLLLGLVGSRFNGVRRLAAARSFIIFDEVHCFSAHTTGLIKMLLSKHSETGGCAAIMSATLPESVRSGFISAWLHPQGNSDEPGSVEFDVEGVPKESYPLLLTADAATGKVTSQTVQDTFRKKIRFRLVECSKKIGRRKNGDVLYRHCLPTGEILEELVGRAKGGEKVALICNLVDDVIDFGDMLKERVSKTSAGIPVYVLHSRFLDPDRAGRENDCLSFCGEEALAGGGVVVASQVVEQSLNIDYDFIVLQLSPADSMLQRLGRLWRFLAAVRKRFQSVPECVVLCPEGVDAGTHQLVYGGYGAKGESTPSLLWRTKNFLERKMAETDDDVLSFPELQREWVKSVYDAESLPGEPAVSVSGHSEWKKYNGTSEAQAVFTASRETKKDGEAEKHDESGTSTRGGEESVRLLLVEKCGDGSTKLLGNGVAYKGTSDMNPGDVESSIVRVPESWKEKLHGTRFVFSACEVEMEQKAQGEYENDEMVYSRLTGLRKKRI